MDILRRNHDLGLGADMVTSSSHRSSTGQFMIPVSSLLNRQKEPVLREKLHTKRAPKTQQEMSQEVLFVKLGKDSKLSLALLTNLNLLREQRTGTSLATP